MRRSHGVRIDRCRADAAPFNSQGISSVKSTLIHEPSADPESPVVLLIASCLIQQVAIKAELSIDRFSQLKFDSIGRAAAPLMIDKEFLIHSDPHFVGGAV